jgi:hypothetical protein
MEIQRSTRRSFRVWITLKKKKATLRVLMGSTTRGSIAVAFLKTTSAFWY